MLIFQHKFVVKFTNMQETFIKETISNYFYQQKRPKRNDSYPFSRPMFPNESCRERNEK